jgi:hypothetical protein
MVKWWHILIALVVGVFVGLLLGREHSVVTTYTTIDTVVHYRPMPTAIATTEVRTITMPRLLFAPADTVHTTTVIVKGDSVQLQVPIERKEYRDSTYYAVVSGAVVGDIHPTLEHIETYSSNTVQTTYIYPPKVRPYISGAFGKQSVGAGAGILICNKHAVGVDYTYAGGKGNLMARYSFVFR